MTHKLSEEDFMYAAVRCDIKKKKVGGDKKSVQQWLYGLPRMNG
jgi:hypothetical protein